MKHLLRVVVLLALLATSAFAKIKGSETPHLISDEIAYRQLFLILTVDKAPQSAASVQAYCDFVLKLTQPEKEELLRLVDSFNAIEKEAGESHKKAEKVGDKAAIKAAREKRKTLGKIMANAFSAKEKLDAVLEQVKKGTEIDEGDEF